MIKLKPEIIWTGGLPHLSGLPHLPGVPLLHVNRPLVRQVLDGRLIDLTTMEKLLLERQKDGRDRFIEVAAQ